MSSRGEEPGRASGDVVRAVTESVYDIVVVFCHGDFRLPRRLFLLAPAMGHRALGQLPSLSRPDEHGQGPEPVARLPPSGLRAGGLLSAESPALPGHPLCVALRCLPPVGRGDRSASRRSLVGGAPPPGEPAAVWGAAGIGLGLVLHPYFPLNLVFTYRHLAEKFLPSAPVPVGREWAPYDSRFLLASSALAFLLFAAGVLTALLRSRKLTTRECYALALALFFLILAAQSRRFIEYAPPWQRPRSPGTPSGVSSRGPAGARGSRL